MVLCRICCRRDFHTGHLARAGGHRHADTARKNFRIELAKASERITSATSTTTIPPIPIA
jgi:hypothetical protein